MLAACSVWEHEERPPWRAEAEEACLSQGLAHVSAYVQPVAQIDGPGICGLFHPFKVRALANETVAVNKTQTLACPMLPALDQWLTQVVQPEAQADFGAPVVELKSLGSYGCRSIDNQYGAALSEHAFGNAIDIAGFTLADGRFIEVMHGWRGDERERAFLRHVHAGACQYFTTVLGPGADMFHYNHIHVDLARHAAQQDGTMRHICKPVAEPLTDTQPPVLSALDPVEANPPLATLSAATRPRQSPAASSGEDNEDNGEEPVADPNL
jgi:hypothetical protein